MKGRAGLFVAIVIGALAISIDFASVDLAIPALQREFGMELDAAQWVINAYVLAFAVFMVAGGRLADDYGRRRVFLVGMTIFGVASLIGGMAWGGAPLIACRVLQGVGAALLWPALIGISCAAVDQARRGFALGLIMGTCSIGNAAGPVVGGALTQWLSWRWVLWINVPMALLAMAITLALAPRDPPSVERERMDWLGTAILGLGLVALIVGVDQAGVWGWGDLRVIGMLAVAAILLGLFPFVERRVAQPLVPTDMLDSAEFMTLCLAALGVCQFFFVVLLYAPQFAMKFLGDDAMRAGAQVVPFMAGFGLVSFLGGRLYALLGARWLLICGLVATILGSVGLAFAGLDGGRLVPGAMLVLLGIGTGAAIPSIGTRAVEVAGMKRASLASGVTFMLQLSGAALLFAVATTIFSASGEAALDRGLAGAGIALSAPEREAVDGLLVGPATARTLTLPHIARASALSHEVLTVAESAYRVGLRDMLLSCAGLAAVILLLVFRFVRGEPAAKAETKTA